MVVVAVPRLHCPSPGIHEASYQFCQLASCMHVQDGGVRGTDFAIVARVRARSSVFQKNVLGFHWVWANGQRAVMMNKRMPQATRDTYIYKVGTRQLPIAGGARQSRSERFAAVQEKQVPDNLLECSDDRRLFVRWLKL